MQTIKQFEDDVKAGVSESFPLASLESYPAARESGLLDVLARVRPEVRQSVLRFKSHATEAGRTAYDVSRKLREARRHMDRSEIDDLSSLAQLGPNALEDWLERFVKDCQYFEQLAYMTSEALCQFAECKALRQRVRELEKPAEVPVRRRRERAVAAPRVNVPGISRRRKPCSASE